MRLARVSGAAMRCPIVSAVPTYRHHAFGIDTAITPFTVI